MSQNINNYSNQNLNLDYSNQDIGYNSTQNVDNSTQNLDYSNSNSDTQNSDNGFDSEFPTFEFVGVRRGRGYRFERGGSRIYPFRKNSRGKTDYDSMPGEIEDSWGFDPSLPDDIQSHLQGECSDALRNQLPKRVKFPAFELPAIQFAVVRESLDGYSTVPSAFPSFNISLDLSQESARELSAIINARNPLPATFAAAIAGNIKNRLKEFAQKATDAKLFTEPFNILYTLRLSNGEQSLVSAPVAIYPNELSWRIALTSSAVTSNGISIQCALFRSTCRIAISMPDTESNHQWKEYISNLPWAERITAIDFFASPAGTLFPEGNMTGTCLSPSSSACSTFLDNDTLSFSSINTSTIYSGLLYEPKDNNSTIKELNDPTLYRKVASLQLKDIPDAGKWITLDLSCAALFNTKPDLFKPAYDSMLPGEGEEFLTALGCSLAGNVKSGMMDCVWPMACAPVKSPDDEWKSPANYGEQNIYLGIRRGTKTIYLRQESSEGWRSIDKGSLALFHPSPDVMEIIEEDVVHERFRRYPMTHLSSGGSIWRNTSDSPVPEWEEGDFSDLNYFTPIGEYLVDCPGLLLCSPPELDGWYPTVCRITLPTLGRLRGLVWFNGSGSGNRTLLAFTNEGIWRLAYREFTHEGIERMHWITDTLLSSFTAYGPHAIMSIRSGTVFIGQSGVMMQQGSNTRRLSQRGKTFPENSILVYHQAADILEAVQPAQENEPERRIWLFDLEDNKELLTSNKEKEEHLPLLTPLQKYEYRVLTRPFRLEESQYGKIAGIRIATTKGIGNFLDYYDGVIIVQYSRNLHDWHTLQRNGLELLYPHPEAYPGKRMSTLWWRVAAGVPTDAGIPTGIEIIVDNL